MIERILCLDPSFTPGWTILEFVPDSNKLSIAEHGTTTFNKSKHPYRDLTLLINHICKEYSVTHFIYEKQFYAKMYQIVGACLGGIPESTILLNKKGISKIALEKRVTSSKTYNFDYKQIRKILFNNVKITKEETKQKFLRIYSIEDWTLDETDALALGLAYIRQCYDLILDSEVFECY